MPSPIDIANTPQALDLLAKGFPNRPRAYWAASLNNLERFGGNQAAGVPPGYLLYDKQQPVGVLLTPASLRYRRGRTPERIVNLASWYMEPAHCWRAPLMLRSILRDIDATFTDLTPTPGVQKILSSFGFQQTTRGISLSVLALAAVTGSGGSSTAPLADLAQLSDAQIDPDTRQLLTAHSSFGCVATAFEENGVWYPLLFKLRSFRGIPAAILVYCESNAALERNLARVARYLLRHRRLALVLDVPIAKPATGLLNFARTPRFARGDLRSPDCTDHAGSELTLFGT